MSKQHSHPWAIDPDSPAGEVWKRAGAAYLGITQLGNGLRYNHPELERAIHVLQFLALESVAESRLAEDLFSPEERRLLAEIDEVVELASSITDDDTRLQAIELARDVLRTFVIAAARQRTAAPDRGNWYWRRRSWIWRWPGWLVRWLGQRS